MQGATEIFEEDAVLAQSLENEFEIQFYELRYQYFNYSVEVSQSFYIMFRYIIFFFEPVM